MNATEQCVFVTTQMYECRDVARQLLGEKFGAKMRELAKVISSVSKRDRCSAIKAGATVIKSEGLEGMRALMLMAAVVEMVEPSQH